MPVPPSTSETIIQLALYTSHKLAYTVGLVGSDPLILGMRLSASPNFTRLGQQSLDQNPGFCLLVQSIYVIIGFLKTRGTDKGM